MRETNECSAGHDRVCHWRQTRLVLEINTFETSGHYTMHLIHALPVQYDKYMLQLIVRVHTSLSYHRSQDQSSTCLIVQLHN